jgi:hypothetical protein
MSDANKYYGVGGLLKEPYQEHRIYAKEDNQTRQPTYWIRAAVTGPDVPHLLNPWGMNFTPDVDDKIFDSQLGKRKYEFRKVTKEAFDMYITFLQKGRELYLRQAERSLD